MTRVLTGAMPSTPREESLEEPQPTALSSDHEMGTVDGTNVVEERIEIDPAGSREGGKPINLTDEVDVKSEMKAADLEYSTGGESGAEEAPPSVASSGQPFDVSNATAGLEPYIPGMYHEGGEQVKAGLPQFSEQHGDDVGAEVKAEASQNEESGVAQLDVMVGDMKQKGYVGDGEYPVVHDGGAEDSKYGENKGSGHIRDAGGMKFSASGSDGRIRRERTLFDDSRIEEQQEEGQVVDVRDGVDVIPGVDDLPVFATEQSKALNDEIKRREKMVVKADIALTDHRERVHIMEEHLRNVRQEVGHTNALMAAKKKEIATEEHLCALAAREVGRYRHEARRLVAESEEVQDKLNIVQNKIFSANESMDRFKLQMNWNQEELEQWALAAKQKEEDNLALQKYARVDDVKIKELSLQVERLSKSVVAKRAELQNLEAEASAKQVELDNTAEDFRQLHAERQDLVRQWQTTIDSMRRRDTEINTVGDKYAAARQVRVERAEALAQNAARLKMQKNDNQEVQASIENLERSVQRRRQEGQEAKKRLEEFGDVLEVVKNTLGNGAGALTRKRAENANLMVQIEEKRAYLDSARRKYQVSKHRVETETGNTHKAEATTKSAEEELQQQEANSRAAKKSLAMVKELMFRDSQKLYTFRQEEANLIAEICGAQATMKNLHTKVHALDQEQTRQQELIYSAEFQIQQMERKVARGMGERTDQEKQNLNTKIQQLEGDVEVVREEKKMLVAQARKLNNELRASLRRREIAAAQQGKLNEAINELQLECRAAEGDVRRESQTKEELMVSNDVMRLEVKRLRDTLNGAADEVFSLENRRQQLAMSMKERKAEIQVHWDLQRATLRAAEEERHRVQLELGDRRQAVEKLRAKYETLAKGFAGAGAGIDGGSGSGGGGGSSQAYFIIAAAQKREELQREGDELDQEIRRCEREIRALESTLRHLNARNVDFRVSFQRADPGSRDADALRSLEARAKVAQDTLFRRKKDFQRAQTDHEEDLARLGGARVRAARLDEQNAQLESVRNQVRGELDAQSEALSKMNIRLARHRANHRKMTNTSTTGPIAGTVPSNTTPAPVAGSNAATMAPGGGGGGGGGCGGETLTEKALRASTIRDTASGVLYTLGQLAREFPEMHDALIASLNKLRLKIPHSPPTHGPAGIGSGGMRGGAASVPSSARFSQSAGSTRSSRSGGRAGLENNRGGGGAGVTSGGLGISPMRVFEAPM